MGNQRIKLSYMIPNAWFYKLKDMNNNKGTSNKYQCTTPKRGHLAPPLPPPSQTSPTIKTTNDPPLYHARKSYHITRELINPPREIEFQPFSPPKSYTKSRKSSRRTSSMSSSSSKSTTTFHSYPSKTNSPSSPPIFEDFLLKTNHKTEDYDVIKDHINTFQLKLSPIRTKQDTNTTKFSSKEEKIIAPIIKEHKIIPTPRRYQEKGVRLKVNSPRIMGRKQGQKGNSSRSSKRSSSLSESFAVVKSSFDPQKDFKESMMEMIVQNNIRGSKDLEDLLACYLSLNTVEYHDVIIKVFKQIWFDLRHLKQIA